MSDLVPALLAGAVTIAAPCMFVMLPVLFGVSIGQTSNTRPLMIALGFVTSFSVAALWLAIVTDIFDFDPNALRIVADVCLVGFGLAMMWPALFRWLSTRPPGLERSYAADGASGQCNVAGFLLGAALGLVWTPCAGPVLAPIPVVIARSDDASWESALLVAYAVGAAIPILAVAYGSQAVTTRVRGVARISPRLQRGFGLLVTAFAIMSYFQYDMRIMVWMAEL